MSNISMPAQSLRIPLEELQTLIEKATCFIASKQNPDGSFESFSSIHPDNLSTGKRRLTTFQTSLILGALSDIAQTNQEANAICKRAAHFLLQEKSENWSWNYWSQKSMEAKTMPYPDDLDDTFLALSALHRFDKKLVGPKGLAAT